MFSLIPITFEVDVRKYPVDARYRIDSRHFFIFFKSLTLLSFRVTINVTLIIASLAKLLCKTDSTVIYIIIF